MPIIRNLLTNPSFEANAAGWAGVDATVAHAPGAGAVGGAALRVTAAAGAPFRGAYYSPVPAAGLQAGPVSAGVLVRAAPGTPLSLTITSTGTGALEQVQPFTGTGAWQWVTVTTPAVSDTRNPYLLVRTTTADAATFDLDAAMIVAGPAMPNYADGDTSGWVWDGAPHASTSRGPDTPYRPEAQLRWLDGAHVAWLDLLDGFELQAESASRVHDRITPGPLTVTHRPAGGDTGTLVARFHRHLGEGTPAQRAVALYRALKSGGSMAVRWEYAPLDVYDAGQVSIVPTGGIAVRRDGLEHWTVEATYTTRSAGEVAP